ncbi:MAG: molybdopterin oxidoreductase family protein [Micropruina sp.]|nr:molybdopterin oxidoreductase family protein [Micropruina sp.]
MTNGIDTHCPYCALQCGMRLEIAEPGSPVPVIVRGRDFPVNRGGLCQKGWTSAALLNSPERLTTPLIRRDGRLEPASWEEAYAEIVQRVTAIKAEHGADGLAVFGGGGLTNEKAYTLGKFARVALGTRYIDYNGRFCMSSAAAAGNRSFGIDRGLPFPVTDLATAGVIVLLGSNVADTMPPFVQHLAGARAHGGLVVTDPRRSATAQLTENGGGIHLQLLPGTDLTLLLGLTHLVIAQQGVDTEYVQARVNGYPDVLSSVAEWWPERTEEHTGVPASQLREVADLLVRNSPRAGGPGVFLLTGRGAEQHAHGTDTVQAAINLALLLGLPGQRGSGYGCLTGQGNGQGGREHGQKSDQLPGYRMIADPAARAHVAAVWGIDPDSLPGPGVPAVELLARLGTADGPRGLFVHGSNLVVSAPNASVVEQRLRSLDLLVVCDLVLSETARLADVVLPITQWAEEDGTMTNLEGRVLRRKRALAPPEGVRDELQVLTVLAQLLDSRGHFSADSNVVFNELSLASAGGKADYGGIDHERLDHEAIYWPCPTPEHPGTPRLFETSFPTPDGRATMWPVKAVGVADDVRPKAPLYLITGRVLPHYQSGAQTRRVAELRDAEDYAYVQLHPLTAQRLGIEEGSYVEVTSARGHAVAPARLSSDLRLDTVFMPFHFPGDQRANTLTTDATDPISGMPEYKVCAVSVRRAHGYPFPMRSAG